MQTAYLPNDQQAIDVKNLVQSAQMPIADSYQLTGLVNADGLTLDNVRVLAQFYHFPSNLDNCILVGVAPAHTGTPPTAADMAGKCQFYAFFFNSSAMAYGRTDPNDYTYTTISAWYTDNTYATRYPVACINFYYLNGWNLGNYVNWYDTTTNWNIHSMSNVATTDIYIIESTLPVDYNNSAYDPTMHDEHIFTKDYNTYKMYVGVAVNETTVKTDYIYATNTYKIRLRWQSLRTGTSYTMNMAGRLVYNNATVLTPSTIPPAPFYSFSYNTDSAAPYAKALRMPVGAFETAADIPTDYSDLTDLRAVSETTLQQLVDYMQTQTAGATEQDAFTEIFADFMDVNDVVLDTKSCDYSSLFGSDDIDINGGTINNPNDEPSINDTNVYSDSIDLTTPTLTATGVFNRCYVLDGNGVNDLCDFLYNASDSVFDEIIDGVLTRGNPIESLIDLRLYPFDVRAFTGAGTPEFIKFGRTQTTVAASKLPHNANAVISLGSCVVPRYYNNFLDYEMDAKLYIPFCGVCDLPIDRILNHTLSIKLIVDYITGACCAVVYVDSLPLVYQSGVIGVSIPMTATDSAEFGKSIIGNLITGATQTAGKNPAAAVGSFADAASKIWNGSDLQTAGSSSPQVALYQPKNAYLLLSIVNPPSGVYDDVYAASIGYATFMPVSAISWMNGSGFTVFDNVQLTVGQATDAERDEILSLLTSGVYM